MKKPSTANRTLLASLSACLMLIVLSGYLHPYFRRPDVPPVAEWHMINVHGGGLRGDANLLLAGDQVVMIDAGLRAGAYRSVVPYLRDLGIGRIHHFFISTPRPASYEGLGALINKGFAVDNVYFHPVDMTAKTGDEYHPDALGHYGAFLDHARTSGSVLHPVEPGFVLELPNRTRLRVVAAGDNDPATVTTRPGDASMLLRFELPRSSVLFSGGTGNRLGSELASRTDLHTRFLKAPPPGPGAAPEAFLNAVRPDFVLVPGAKRHWCSDYGETARSWTMEHETPTWVTGTNGHIRVIWQTRQVMVLPQTQNEICKLREFGNLIR
jgi:beta-lactamase superfamily II metal-dependent hydrolase